MYNVIIIPKKNVDIMNRPYFLCDRATIFLLKFSLAPKCANGINVFYDSITYKKRKMLQSIFFRS